MVPSERISNDVRAGGNLLFLGKYDLVPVSSSMRRRLNMTANITSLRRRKLVHCDHTNIFKLQLTPGTRRRRNLCPIRLYKWDV